MTLGEHNLAKLGDDAFARNGDREHATFFEGRWYSSGETHERTQRLAAGLVDLGIAPGDRIVVHMANCPEVGMTYAATWRAGAVTTPAIFLLPEAELRYVLEDSGATAVVTTPEFLEKAQAASDGLEDLRHVICVGRSGDGVIDLHSLEQHEPGGLVPRADHDLAALLYTGGTTGRAKGVPLTHHNLAFCARAAQEAGQVDGINRTIVPLPLAHAYGLAVTVAGAFVEDPGPSVLMRWFDPQAILELVAEHRIQRATLVPSMIQLLLSQPLEEHDLSTLTFVNCGASPLAEDVALTFEERVPSATILEGYGCTESGGIAATNPPGVRKLGTVGLPLPGYDIRIVDEEGDERPVGELGEVTIASPGVMDGYWGRPDATDRSIRDGWFHTGDIGCLDEDGYLSIVDRKKDLIIRGGFNVYPRDVEDALVEHPAVTMAGVVGRPDERYGEEVVAFVSLSPGQDVEPDELVAFAKERIGGYKYPREVRIVDQVPLTPILKVDRKRLREMV
ncbi:MAG: AMP-binding protein [Actinobacteria bacterium]|nr:AMP-binding protein [Actinomycetota bacterium]